MISDEVLVEQAKLGKKEAFEELVKRYQTLVYFVIARTIENQQEAEDVFQSAFESTLENLQLFDPDKASFKTWFFSIVRRRCSDSLRRSKKESPSEEILHKLNQRFRRDSTDGFVEVELKESLKSALLNISEEQRLCLVLRSIGGLSYAEIAAIMNVPVGTIRSRISIARKNLLKQIPYLLGGGIECSAMK